MTRQKEQPRAPGRKTKKEIAKGNQMTALRFQTVAWTSNIPGLSSGVAEKKVVSRQGLRQQKEKI